MSQGVGHEAVRSLDEDQLRAVDSPARTLRVLAGAGSGKTRVLTQRIARRIADESALAQHTLVLTFTRKAADELSERLQRLNNGEYPPVQTGTFHAVAYAQLRRRWIDRGAQMPAVMSQPARLVNAVLERLRMDRIANPRAIVAEISWAKAHRLKPNEYVEGAAQRKHRGPVSPTQMQRIFEAYETEKKRRRVVDYDDLLLQLTEALHTDRSFAATQRWQFRHFFVDEFQDLNKAQFELLRAWLGDRDDLFVVGDPNQAIYGWNGANASYLNSLERLYPELETITLRTNYRSSQNVLAAAHSLISTTATTPAHAIVGEAPVVREFQDEEAEADGVVRAVRSAHHRNFAWSDIAVLVRTNAQRKPIEEALARYSIPYRAAGGAAWLLEPSVRKALDGLREDPSSPLAQKARDIDELIEGESDDYLQQLQTSIRAALKDNFDMTVADFLAWVEIGSKQDGPVAAAGSGSVTVTTFHRAKGLEWPVVFLAGVENEFVPISGADIEEEKRLFYVAITRAQVEVHLSWARQRTVGVKQQAREPSPWLGEMLATGQQQIRPPASDVHQAIDDGRAVLHLERADEPKRTALEKWRSRRAKMTGVESRLILDDRVIDELVKQQPTSRDELALIEGLGPVRAASIGSELLTLLSGES
jgi:DNA helicase II / ATP-dependent DNA helicase PcrA